MRIFLDANVLFSASNEQSSVARLLALLQESHTLASSAYALAEASRNLHAKRPQWVGCFEALCEITLLCPQVQLSAEVELAEKDRPILAAAIAGKCDFLVTGDRKDFGHLFGASIQGVKVVSLAQLAEELLE